MVRTVFVFHIVCIITLFITTIILGIQVDRYSKFNKANPSLETTPNTSVQYTMYATRLQNCQTGVLATSDDLTSLLTLRFNPPRRSYVYQVTKDNQGYILSESFVAVTPIQ